MHVVCYSTLEELTPLAADWDRLAREVPFRSWAWLTDWWKQYGRDHDARRELLVLGAFQRDCRLAGLAPWYVERSPSQGNVIRFLGSGEVCSDYLSVLCEPNAEPQVAEKLAEWLTVSAGTGNSSRWDLLHGTGIDAEDVMIRLLLHRLAEHGHVVHCRPGLHCWRIELPRSWEAFLAMLSRDHRKQVRRAERNYVGTGRAVLHTVRTQSELEIVSRTLIELHQRRWRQQGKPGCFRSKSFTAFHRQVMRDLLAAGKLQLQWLELDGRPVAAEYQLTGGGVVYMYLAGIEPECLEHSPGRLANMMSIRRAIEDGFRAFDFLRGDEPYKAHWRACARPSVEFRVVPAHFSARVRHGVWLAGSGVKRWLKSGLRLVGKP